MVEDGGTSVPESEEAEEDAQEALLQALGEVRDSQERLERALAGLAERQAEAAGTVLELREDLRVLCKQVGTVAQSFPSSGLGSQEEDAEVRSTDICGMQSRARAIRFGESGQAIACSSSNDKGFTESSSMTFASGVSEQGSTRQRASVWPQEEVMKTESVVGEHVSMRWARSGTCRGVFRSVLTLPTAWPSNLGLRENFRKNTSLYNDVELTAAAEALRCEALGKGGLLRRQTATALNRTSFKEAPAPAWVVRPSSRLRLVLDLVSMLVLLSDLATAPYILAWDVDVQGPLLYVVAASLIFWTLDILVNFRLGYYKKGVLELRPYYIARRYLRSTFVLDFTMVVVEWFSLVLFYLGRNGGGHESFRILRTMKVSRALRVLNLVRLARMAEVFERFGERNMLSSTGSSAIEVVKIFCFIIWLNHLVCCLWYAIGRAQASDTGGHWLDLPGTAQGEVMSEAGEWYQYCTAFHWSLTQMTPGSMKVEPQNSFERIFNICCLLFGLLCFSTLVSLLSSKMMHMTMLKQDQNNKMTQLRRFLRQQGVGVQLSMSIQKQALNLLSGARILTVKDIHCLKILPQSQQSELYYEMFKGHLASRAFFRVWAAADLASLKHLCFTVLESRALQAQDNLFLAGVSAEAAFVLVRGDMHYKQFPDSSRVPEVVTTEVDTGCWISEAALWCNWMHVGTAEATSSCEVLSINAEAFIKCIMNQHLVKHFAREYAIHYHSRLTAAAPPNAAWPTDLRVEYTDCGEMFAAMSQRMQKIVGMLVIELMIKTKWFWSRHNIMKLQEEVQSGQTILMPAVNGESRRVVVKCAAYISRQSDGWIFAQLGHFNHVQVEARCSLPETSVDPGELPSVALDRILSNELSFIGGGCILESVVSTMEVLDTEMYKLRTMEVRIIHNVDFSEDFDLPSTLTAGAPERCHEGWAVPPHNVFVLGDRSEGTCYAWLPPEEFEHLSSSSGARDVEHWLRSLLGHDGLLLVKEDKANGPCKVHELCGLASHDGDSMEL